MPVSFPQAAFYETRGGGLTRGVIIFEIGSDFALLNSACSQRKTIEARRIAARSWLALATRRLDQLLDALSLIANGSLVVRY